jgi:hypothetical protein
MNAIVKFDIHPYQELAKSWTRAGQELDKSWTRAVKSWPRAGQELSRAGRELSRAGRELAKSWTRGEAEPMGSLTMIRRRVGDCDVQRGKR